MRREVFLAKQRWNKTLFLLQQARDRLAFYTEGSKAKRDAATDIEILETRALDQGRAILTA
jgi:hypothetical protein